MAAAEGLGDQLAHMGFGDIVDRDIGDPLLRNLRRQGVRGTLSAAVDRTVDHHDSLLLGRIAAPEAVLFKDPSEILAPDGAVGRTEDFDVDRSGL